MRTLWHAGAYLEQYEFAEYGPGRYADPMGFIAMKQAILIIADAYNALAGAN